MVRFSLAEDGEKGKGKSFSNFAGLLGIKYVWQRLGLGPILTALGIMKRTGEVTAEDISLLCTSKPLIGANSEQELALKTQRAEQDCIISTKEVIQKKINNFLNCERFDFKEFFSRAVEEVLKEPPFKTKSDDVLIIDDTPLAKTGRSMEWASKLYDAAKGVYYHGYELVALTVARTRRKFFLDFNLKPPSRRK